MEFFDALASVAPVPSIGEDFFPVRRFHLSYLAFGFCDLGIGLAQALFEGFDFGHERFRCSAAEAQSRCCAHASRLALKPG